MTAGIVIGGAAFTPADVISESSLFCQNITFSSPGIIFWFRLADLALHRERSFLAIMHVTVILKKWLRIVTFSE